jgi:hypothetical protein
MSTSVLNLVDTLMKYKGFKSVKNLTIFKIKKSINKKGFKNVKNLESFQNDTFEHLLN